MLRHHPIYSQTLAALVDPRTDVGETIRAHHECFDGGGYPDGLAGQAIPWTARCLAVAVGFVESGQPKQAAIEAILAESGRGYDPEAVRLFLKVTHMINLPRQVTEILLEELQPGHDPGHRHLQPARTPARGRGPDPRAAASSRRSAATTR